MNVKSLSRALRVSDKVVTQLEQVADENKDARVKKLILFYEDLGIEFRRENDEPNGNVIGVVLRDVRKLVLTAAHEANPEKLINDLLMGMRHIAGLIYNLKTTDKSKASLYDTIEIHFPVPVRGMARDILCKWLDRESPFKIVLPDGEEIPMNKSSIEQFFE